jgi:predicted DNA-binding protein (MmcQ/YjbR family)
LIFCSVFCSEDCNHQTTTSGPDALAFKVGGKMFALTTPGGIPARLNLKCNPERAIVFRAEQPSITPRLSHEQTP